MGGAFNLQGFVDGLIALILALGGFIVRNQQKAIDHQTDRHDALVKALPDTYARRDDVKDALLDMKAALIRIEARIGSHPTN